MGRKLKKTTFGGRAWEGFRGTAYYLDSEKVWELPIKYSGEQTTVRKVFESLKEAESIEVESPISGLTVKRPTGEVEYEGLSFNLNVLYVLLTLVQRGVMYPFGAALFYYDSHSTPDDPQYVYRFFIVCDNKIVEEELLFRDYPASGFDPSVFLAADDEPWKQAWVRFWYRKFYTETETGQMMALRPDVPELYYYPSRAGTVMEFRALQVELERIRWLLIVLIIGFIFVYLASR